MKNIKRAILLSLLSIFISGCGPSAKTGQESFEPSPEEVLKGDKMLKDLPANLSAKALKLMRKELGEAFGDDFYKFGCLGIEDTPACTKSPEGTIAKLEMVLANDSRLKEALNDFVPKEVIQYSQFLKLLEREWLANSELLKKVNIAKTQLGGANIGLRQESNAYTLSVKKKIMSELKIDEDRYIKISEMPVIVKLVEAAKGS